MYTRFAIAIFLAAAAFPVAAQTFTYEMRIVHDGDANAPVTPGQETLPYNPTASAVGFWVQARVRVDNPTATVANRGIGRLTSPAGGLASITLISNGSLGTLVRGRVGTSVGADGVPGGGDDVPLFGRGIGFRAAGVPDTQPSPWHSAGANGPEATPFPSAVGNEHGARSESGLSIYGFDAYVGSSRTSAAPIAGQNGVFSQWYNLYRFVLLHELETWNIFDITVTGQLSTVVRTPAARDGTFSVQLGGEQTLTAAGTYSFWPTPGAASLLAASCLLIARRRR